MHKSVLTALASLLLVLCLAPAPAAAVDFSVFGSYMDISCCEDTFGIGARVGFFDFFDHLQVQVTGTWYDSVDDQFTGAGLVNAYPNTLDVVPIDVGATWYFNGDGNDGFYAGAGFTYFNLHTDIGKWDDDTGWFGQVGYQFPSMGLFLEVIYREGDAAITELPFPDEVTERFPVDIAQFVVNAGWRF